MRRAGEMMDVRYRKMNQLFMSGDISFSYPYDKAAMKKLADEKYYKTLDPLKGTDWALIFSRENNFGVGKGEFWCLDEYFPSFYSLVLMFHRKFAHQ